ncbi:MAG TPA: hypothetical protein DD979_07860 [Gammaproteobacteria bacterium]|jgi:uncharacterized protein (TIGR00106 family)|nr:hypothetical protein [Gammaproteobacteria bacterium]
MHAIASFTLIPIGSGISVSLYLAKVEPLLQASGLTYEMTCNSTNIEGQWDAVFALLKRCHEAVHDAGAPRIHSCIQVGTRTDRSQSMADKLASLEKHRVPE